MWARSLATDALNSGVAPTMRVDTESSCRSASIAAIVTRIAWPTCKTIASVVTLAVTLGLPSRSPPIQLPNDNGRAVTGTSIPIRFISRAKSLRTSGTVWRNKSSK
ncbi:unannotated protein [freshwater metagenome]|uniref:Unannotated protein n=1 Tax=freshwater metagenome TaxID=449393 RepID=A0A6J7PMU3_9ZZZZ